MRDINGVIAELDQTETQLIETYRQLGPAAVRAVLGAIGDVMDDGHPMLRLIGALAAVGLARVQVLAEQGRGD